MEKECKIKLCGTWSLGIKWQIVIPKEAREILDIWPWDGVSFFIHNDNSLGIVPTRDFEKILSKAMNDYNITIV